MVSYLAFSRMSTLSCRVDRDLVDVEKVLVSVAQQLDKGMYPPDQVYPATSTTNTPPLIMPCRSVYNSSK